MNGVLNPASLALSISIGTSLLAGFFGLGVAVRPRKDVALHRDTVVPILCGAALLLIVLHAVSAALIAAKGAAYIKLEEAALLLTAARRGHGN